MRARRALTSSTQQNGAALLLCLFALLLLSGIGMFLYMSSGTEARIAANYGSNLDAYYSAKSGLQEVRDRVSYPSPSPSPAPGQPQGGLADLLPKTTAGNANGVLYVINAAPGETVDPTDTNNRYFDDQLCHEYNSGVDAGAKCDVVPGVANWAMPPKTSMAPLGTLPALKWVRINMKTNRSVAPNYCVDQTCAALDTPVCFDGETEQLLPAGSTGECDANGMQNVYMLTALAVTPGLKSNSARRLLRSEVVGPGIRPPGAITMDASSSTAQLSDHSSIPATAIDGRPHKLDGTLASGAACSAVASLATDNTAVTSELQQELDTVRKGIVDKANSSCNADGSSKSGNICTNGLWWVRGTGSTTRFVTSTSGSSTSGSNSGPGGSGGHDDSQNNLISGSGSLSCDPSNASCYTHLDLSAPQLFATSNPFSSTFSASSSPFVGGPGNQSSGSMYQSGLTTTLPHEIATLNALVDSSNGQSNYFEVSPANLAQSYGSQSAPAIVRIVNSSALTLGNTQSLTGYGVLVVPNDLEINGGTLNWTGIVLVQPTSSSGGAQFKVTAGGGFINGALLLQSAGSSTANLISTVPGTSAKAVSFSILYSCDAIDMAFGSLPFKMLGSSEISF
jgi:hypothetical protein